MTEWEKTGRDAAHDDIMRGGEPCTTIAEARLRCGAWLRSRPELGVTDAAVETCAGAYLRAWESHRRETGAAPDLDAINARWRRVGDLAVTRDEDGNLALTDDEDGEGYGIIARMDCDDPGFVEAAEALAGAPRDIAALVARVRDLTAKLAATEQAYDDLVARVRELEKESAGRLACAGFVRDEIRAVAKSVGVLVGDEIATAKRMANCITRLREKVAAARREGAEAMREACVAACADVADRWELRAQSGVYVEHTDDECALIASGASAAGDEVLALPLPGGEP